MEEVVVVKLLKIGGNIGNSEETKDVIIRETTSLIQEMDGKIRNSFIMMICLLLQRMKRKSKLKMQKYFITRLRTLLKKS